MLRTALQGLARQARLVQGVPGVYSSSEPQSLSALAAASTQLSGLLEGCQRHLRGFAEAAAQSQEQRVQLPTQVYGVAGKYAAALYIAGYKAKALDQIDNDLVEVWNTAAKSEQFRSFLKDPSIPKKEKIDTLDTVLTDLNVGELTKNFLGVLAENNRLAEIIRIINTFDSLLAAARGEVSATVTTAARLGKKELDDLKSGLNQVLEKGQTLLIQEKIDPAIIGGIIIDIGDKHIDLSISSRVKRIQQLIRETI